MKLTIRSARHSWEIRTLQKNLIGPLVKASAKISAAAKVEFAEFDSHLDVTPPGMHLCVARDTQCDQVLFRVIPRVAAKLPVVGF